MRVRASFISYRPLINGDASSIGLTPKGFHPEHVPLNPAPQARNVPPKSPKSQAVLGREAAVQFEVATKEFLAHAGLNLCYQNQKPDNHR